MSRFSIILFLFIGALPTAAVPAAQTEQPAPACHASRLTDGVPLDLTQFHGKVVYMDFWASWCGPCRTSFPLLNDLHSELQPRGFEVVAINVDENREDMLRFLEQCPVDFTIAEDPAGKCPETYAVSAMPSSYLIDRSGMIRYIHRGFKASDIEAIRTLVLALLEEPSQP